MERDRDRVATEIVEKITTRGRPVTVTVTTQIYRHRIPTSLGENCGGVMPGVSSLATSVSK